MSELHTEPAGSTDAATIKSAGESVEQTLVEQIRQRAAAVRLRIDDAARASGRDPETVHLIAVTKFFPAEVAIAACAAGLTELGENRVQEMLSKQSALSEKGLKPNWHLIGTLQKNKVRHVIGRTALIHSGDDLDLLREISRRSQAADCITHVLLQINPACEETKHGFRPDEFAAAAQEALTLPGLQIDGIMAMAPLLPDPDETIPFFRLSAHMFEILCERHGQICPGRPRPSVLSMGMSEDFPQAIACGATHIRVGTAIFGPRPTAV